MVLVLIIIFVNTISNTIIIAMIVIITTISMTM